MTIRTRHLLALGVVGAALAAFAGTASADVRFATPSLNIGCYGSSTSVRCDIRNTSGKKPPRPRSCRFDWGTAYGLTRTGRGHGLCASDTTLPDPRRPGPILKYGRSIRVNAKITCTSRRTGLTCRNTKKHGFILSTQRIKLY